MPQNTDLGRDERALLLRLDVLQFLASIAVWMAAFYIAILGKELGLPDYEIGVVAVVYGLSLLFSNYFCGSLSDVHGARLFLIIGFLFSSVMFIVHVFVFDYMSLLWVRLITGAALGIYPGALYAIAHAARTRMGKFSAFGAMGSFVGLAGAGFISAAYGIRSLFLVGAIVLFDAFILALQVRGTNGSSARLSLRPTLTIRQNLSIYTALLTRHTGANMVWTFWSLYLLSLGADNLFVGLITASNALAQFLTMHFLSDKFGSRREFDIGLILSGVLFASLGLVRNFWESWIPYALLGFVWSFVFVGAVRSIVDNSTQKGAAIGVFNSVLNLSSLLGPILATMVIVYGDYKSMMYIAAAFSFVSYIMSRKLKPFDMPASVE
jgi:DHA1 family quinolone resistance protein-like MFS transporter